MKGTVIKCTLGIMALLLSSCRTTGEIDQLRNEITTLKKQISEIKKEQNYSILFLGDILLANHSRKMIRQKGINYPFDKIRDDLKGYDYVIANMETPISMRGTPFRNRYYIFQLHPELAKAITTIKLTAVTLGNNHAYDFGDTGLKDTIKYLRKWNIPFTGAGKNLSSARKPVIINHGETDIVIFSYCGRPPMQYYATENQPGTAPLDIAMITKDIEEYKTRKNLVIISLHWGIEQTHMPQKEQTIMAREIIDAGADAIIGHHPHWPQAVEVYRNKPIIYSLGNFINGHYNKVEKDNLIAALYCSQNTINEIEIMSIAGKNKEVKFQPFIIKGKEAKANLTMIKNLSKFFKTDIEIFGYKGIIKLKD